MTSNEISATEASTLQPDEAIVIVRLNYLTPYAAGGVLNFHYDSAEERKGSFLVRRPDSWFPMFSIPTSSSGKPLLFKVRAGQLSFTQFNSGRYIGDLNTQLSAFAKAGAITYLGDVNLRVEGSRIQYHISEDPSTVENLRDQHPALFARYPRLVNLLSKGF